MVTLAIRSLRPGTALAVPIAICCLPLAPTWEQDWLLQPPLAVPQLMLPTAYPQCRRAQQLNGHELVGLFQAHVA